MYAEDEARLLIAAARTRSELAQMAGRRALGLPLEQVLGWAEFCGLRISVRPGVFVPRRRSEFLVGQALAVTAQRSAVIVDLCCGTGAIGIAIACGLDRAELHAADIDSAAVACARDNVAAVGGRAYHGDLYEPLPSALHGHVDIVVANAPYVPTGELDLMPSEARLHEPVVALDGGPDGLDIQRRIAADAWRWLAPGGHLLIETSERQCAQTFDAVAAGGLTSRVASSDELSATVVIGAPGPVTQGRRRAGRRTPRPARPPTSAR